MIDKNNYIDEETEEELYFKRTDKMKSLIKENYPSERRICGLHR